METGRWPSIRSYSGIFLTRGRRTNASARDACVPPSHRGTECTPAAFRYSTPAAAPSSDYAIRSGIQDYRSPLDGRNRLSVGPHAHLVQPRSIGPGSDAKAARATAGPRPFEEFWDGLHDRQTYWRCGQPDGTYNEVRHAYDFLTVLDCMQSDLSPKTTRELYSRTWMHAHFHLATSTAVCTSVRITRGLAPTRLGRR